MSHMRASVIGIVKPFSWGSSVGEILVAEIVVSGTGVFVPSCPGSMTGAPTFKVVTPDLARYLLLIYDLPVYREIRNGE